MVRDSLAMPAATREKIERSAQLYNKMHGASNAGERHAAKVELNQLYGALLPADVDGGTLADVRAEVIRELIYCAQAQVANCIGCHGAGKVVSLYECYPVVYARSKAVAAVAREVTRCGRCLHLRGIIQLAMEMIP